MIKLPVTVGTKPNNVLGIIDFRNSSGFGKGFDRFDMTHFDMLIITTVLAFGYDSFECVSCVIADFSVTVGDMTSLIS